MHTRRAEHKLAHTERGAHTKAYTQSGAHTCIVMARHTARTPHTRRSGYPAACCPMDVLTIAQHERQAAHKIKNMPRTHTCMAGRLYQEPSPGPALCTDKHTKTPHRHAGARTATLAHAHQRKRDSESRRKYKRSHQRRLHAHAWLPGWAAPRQHRTSVRHSQLQQRSPHEKARAHTGSRCSMNAPTIAQDARSATPHK